MAIWQLAVIVGAIVLVGRAVTAKLDRLHWLIAQAFGCDTDGKPGVVRQLLFAVEYIRNLTETDEQTHRREKLENEIAGRSRDVT